MNYLKGQIQEIIDSNGDLIGKNDIPQNGSNLETQANNTTDYNREIGTQPYRYDMLARFGFYVPFMESDNSKSNDTYSELNNILINYLGDILKFYYKNPEKLKSDYRKFISDDKAIPQFIKITNYLDEILKLFNDLISDKNDVNLTEDKFVEKKSDEFSKKTENNEIKEKNIKKIAGLINKKFTEKDIDKLINLIERKE